MASEDEINDINDPLWDVINVYLLLHNYPPYSEHLFHTLVDWVKATMHCDFIMAHQIVDNRMFKTHNAFQDCGYKLIKRTPTMEEELAYHRWQHTL